GLDDLVHIAVGQRRADTVAHVERHTRLENHPGEIRREGEDITAAVDIGLQAGPTDAIRVRAAHGDVIATPPLERYHLAVGQRLAGARHGVDLLNDAIEVGRVAVNDRPAATARTVEHHSLACTVALDRTPTRHHSGVSRSRRELYPTDNHRLITKNHTVQACNAPVGTSDVNIASIRRW